MDTILQSILEIALQQGIWAALYICLFFRIPNPMPHWLNSTLNHPIIHFKRIETSAQSVTYSCRIEGEESQLVFSVEYILIQENLLIREMNLH